MQIPHSYIGAGVAVLPILFMLAVDATNKYFDGTNEHINVAVYGNSFSKRVARFGVKAGVTIPLYLAVTDGLGPLLRYRIF